MSKSSYDYEYMVYFIIFKEFELVLKLRLKFDFENGGGGERIKIYSKAFFRHFEMVSLFYFDESVRSKKKS